MNGKKLVKLAPEENSVNSTSQESCKCCGTCCIKGGPAFHLRDKNILESGQVGIADVYTIREGEPIYDNVKDKVIFAETDIIKIKGLGQSWSCRFLERATNQCKIYEKRPEECRALKCWDTSEIESIYEKDRLIRKDLLSNVEGLWELIEDHHQECSYHQIRELLKNGDGHLDQLANDRLLEMIKYDLAIRPMVAEKGRLDTEMVDFLLGRPLIETIVLFGLAVKKDGEFFRLVLDSKKDKAVQL